MDTTFDPVHETDLVHLADPAAHNGHLGNGKPHVALSQAATERRFWRKSAPKTLRQGNLTPGAAWKEYWNGRPTRASVAELCGASTTPLRWALAAQGPSGAAQRLLDLAGEAAEAKKTRKFIETESKRVHATLAEWLAASKNAPPNHDVAIGCLAAVHLVAAGGGALDAGLGWQLLDYLADTARLAQVWSPLAASDPQAVVAQQLLAGELPLALAYHFPEMAPLYALRTAASERLSEALDELLNGEGLPHARYLPSMRPLLACWTRCRAMGLAVKKGRWSKKAQRQYEWLVYQALRWTASDGTPLLAPDGAERWPNELLRTALRLGGSRKDAAAAKRLLGKRAVGKAIDAERRTPPGSDHCEWACLAAMRSGWSRSDSVVAVDYSSPDTKIDVWAGGRRLFAGAWTAQPRVDGQALQTAGPWEELCWFSDQDVDYLELQLPLEGGARLERQILLAHRDGFLLLADHLQNPHAAALRHDWQLPLGPALLFCGDGETRDAVLVDGQPIARLLPLALPEWRIDPRVGDLDSGGGAVRLSQQAHARALACPLFIDLRADRAGEPCTWRQLTVAESLAIQPPDVAVGYRMQSGGKQWVYYRSQAERGNRTFLGQNTSSECVVARFKAPSGKVTQLLEIEG